MVEQEKKANEKKPMPAKSAQKIETDKSVVYIGVKPVKNYVIACMTRLNTGGNKTIVKARGRAISGAVDTVELLRRAFMKDLLLEGINLYTEEVKREGGREANVSTIEITVAKP
jgi:DNA-binding protein